jgi:hypothetical protein
MKRNIYNMRHILTIIGRALKSKWQARQTARAHQRQAAHTLEEAKKKRAIHAGFNLAQWRQEQDRKPTYFTRRERTRY